MKPSNSQTLLQRSGSSTLMQRPSSRRSSFNNGDIVPPPPPPPNGQANATWTNTNGMYHQQQPIHRRGSPPPMAPPPIPSPTITTRRVRNNGSLPVAPGIQKRRNVSAPPMSRGPTTRAASSSSGIPQAFIDESADWDPTGKRRASKWRRCLRYLGILVVGASVVGFGFVAYQDRVLTKKQLVEQEKAMRDLEMELSMQFDTQIQKLQKDNASLNRQAKEQRELKVENQRLKDQNHKLELASKNDATRYNDSKRRVLDLQEENNKLQELKKTYNRKKKETQEKIQLMSKREILKKYGPGPHRVEMLLRFDSHLGRNDEGRIVIEMAPIHLMPHSVYWFLEQVSERLFDGTSFYQNPGHVIQAGPIPNFLSSDTSYKKFAEKGLSTLVFQEHSEKYPHKKYTLGYSGKRPGGPDFYISTRDNTLNHGPGGQEKYDDPTEGEPCFAKVVDGINIVNRINQSPIKGNGDTTLRDNVAIVSMRIIGKSKR